MRSRESDRNKAMPLATSVEPEPPVGIYIHVPFCSRRCSYCDFYTLAGGVRGLERYLQAVELDLQRTAEGLEDRSCRPHADTVYLGGGTPSLLPADAIGRLIGACQESFELPGEAEITLELNPEAPLVEHLESVLGAGVNRISVGVQSFHDDVLQAVGRPHDRSDVVRTIGILRDLGLGNLSIDLIAGLPGTSLASFQEDVEEALALQPDHISVYMLETDKPTPLARAASSGGIELPDEDETAEMFERASGALAGSGMHHYEISNWARPGFESRHNLKHWLDLPLLGVGPSAWSYLSGRRLGRIRGLPGYLEAVESGRTPVDEEATLPPEAAAAEALYLGLRLLDGVQLRPLSTRYGVALDERFGSVLDRLHDDGLVAWDPVRAHVCLTPRGVMMSNEVFGEFVR